MQTAKIGALAVALLIGSIPPASAQSPSGAGMIKVMSGSVVIVRNGEDLPAKLGQTVLETDALRTGADGGIRPAAGHAL